jgi:2-polyprenyl-6-methoxyphenol hydroxylase-like FAD-dependent oxidoreductase
MGGARVLVIGAGLGGLCLAHGLRRAGIDVAVYDRDPAPATRGQGYRVHIDPDGLDGLRRCLPPELYELFLAVSGVPAPQVRVYDWQLAPVHTEDLAGGTRNRGINRLTLRQLLLHGLDDAVRFGAEFTHYEPGPGDRVTAHFAGGGRATGDALVAADGIGSAVRRQYLPHASIVDTSLRIVYGTAPITGDLGPCVPDCEFTAILGPGKRFVGVAAVQPGRRPAQAAAALVPGLRLDDHDDYLMCLFGARREYFGRSDEQLRTLDGTGLRRLVLAMTEGWHDHVRALLARADPASAFLVTIRSSVPVPRWRTTNVTLLGDAIHAMSPTLGAGANTAFRDAAVLSRQLARDVPVRQALHAYETEMTGYAFAAVRASAEHGQQLLDQDPLPGHSADPVDARR